MFFKISKPLIILMLASFLPLAVYAKDEIKTPDFIATIYQVKRGDSLYEIAFKFDLALAEILKANPQITEEDLIHVGQKIILPTTHLVPAAKREGVLINLAELRLYFFKDNASATETFPIAIGADEKTPVGKTKIALKREKPSWIPPDSIREEDPNLPEIVEPGPNNPLGEYALNLDGSKNAKWSRIVIHGTNSPRSIGGKVSHGCIRMYPWDIKDLFEIISVGTVVRIVNQPLKIEEIEGALFLESHLEDDQEFDIEGFVCSRVKDCEKSIDWEKVYNATEQSLGIPIRVSL